MKKKTTKLPKAKKSKPNKPIPAGFKKKPGFLTLISTYKGWTGAIVTEILNEMSMALATVGKTFTPNALHQWQPKLSEAVFLKLMYFGGNWGNDRSKVLTVAHDMAIIAAILAGGSATVSQGHVHAAFRAAKDHTSCPGSGSGAWCDFNV